MNRGAFEQIDAVAEVDNIGVIAEAELDDICAITELESRCIECAWTLKLHTQAFKTDGYKYLVFKTAENVENGNKSKGKIIGYIIVRIILDEAEICNIAVEKSYRRKKIAKKLLTAAKNYCISLKCTQIFLEVSAKNVPAIELYKSNGFEQTGIRRNYYESGDAILMRKAL